MRKNRDAGRTITMLGASFFIVLAAALSLSLYGEALSKTKSVVLMVFATLSAFVLSIGRYLQSVELKRNNHPPVGKTELRRA